jgi:GTP-binding protein HflX
MNKIDLQAPEALVRLRARYPDAWFVSAKNPADVALVRTRIIDLFEASYEEVELTIPYDRQGVLSEMHETGRVVAESWDEAGVTVRWRAEAEAIGRVRARLR